MQVSRGRRRSGGLPRRQEARGGRTGPQGPRGRRAALFTGTARPGPRAARAHRATVPTVVMPTPRGPPWALRAPPRHDSVLPWLLARPATPPRPADRPRASSPLTGPGSRVPAPPRARPRSHPQEASGAEPNTSSGVTCLPALPTSPHGQSRPPLTTTMVTVGERHPQTPNGCRDRRAWGERGSPQSGPP